MDLKKTLKKVQDLLLDNQNHILSSNPFHLQMSTANIEKIKRQVKPVVMDELPREIMTEFGGIVFTINDMMPDNRIAVVQRGEVIGIINLDGEK